MNTLRHYYKKISQKEAQYNHKMFLPPYFKDLIGDKKEVNIADLGSAMFCTIGDLWDGVKINMYASDILADEFNKMLKDAKITPVIPIEKQDNEKLTYADNFFDIVHCVNTLDHVVNPNKALQEMLRVCKPGGYIYLRHFPNVGVHENYSAFHQWNINMIENGDVSIYNKNGFRYLLSDFFKSFKVKYFREQTYDINPKRMIVVIIQK
jgi:ubiquinone/menaquinone biosynthesis C-methylase UbiE